MKDLLSRLKRPVTGEAAPASGGGMAYVVNHSYPYSSNGYAVRTHGIASALVQQGVPVFVLNRPGHPWDLPGQETASCGSSCDLDGVRYLFFRKPSIKELPLGKFLSAVVDVYKEAFRTFRPGMVLAASNWENALPAAVAARELGLPFCYEVRGFWELSRVSREPSWKRSRGYKDIVARETALANAANRVFTLNRFMLQELVRRGVQQDKIEIVSNAYARIPDLDRRPAIVKEDLGIRTRYTVGYVGSFSPYEGLHDLVRACAAVRGQGVDLSLLLLGSANSFGVSESSAQCPMSAELRALAQELGFAGYLHLPGRTTSEGLSDYYRMIDLVVIPRKALPVCELVSPIKPFEAMAYGKAILLSDVAPLKELADLTGIPTFSPASVSGLTQQIRTWLADDAARTQLGWKLQQLVATHYRFTHVVGPIVRQANRSTYQRKEQTEVTLQKGQDAQAERTAQSPRKRSASRKRKAGEYSQVLEGVTRKLLKIMHTKTFRKQLKKDIRLLSKNALFDATYYVEKYPDVTKSRFSPAAHYVMCGWAEFRNPNELFDTYYYLSKNRDVLGAPVNPLVHFIKYGWKEMRNPSAAFNVKMYLDNNSDVAASGMNPLAHYLFHGKLEGRSLPGVKKGGTYQEFRYPERAPAPAYVPENTVLYLLHNSLPYNSGGYATRTHGLLKGVGDAGQFVVHGVTRPGYPSDHTQFISRPLPRVIPPEDVIEGIRYLRCDQLTRRSGQTIGQYADVYAQQVEPVARTHRAGIIHAASNHPNGLAANIAARRLGVRSVYEVRGLWEITRLSREEDFADTDTFSNMARMETEACNGADAVLTITGALKALMVERGVPPEKITVVPNCVDVERFVPRERDLDLARKLGIGGDDTVIGYIGSLVNYEGLDRLLSALHILRGQGLDKFRFLIVGDGTEMDLLLRMVQELDLRDVVIAPGRVPFDEVPRYYSLVDITPFPREPYAVCEIVSPLKPFEAMALAKGVLVSSCTALTEIVDNGKTGLVFEKGNTDDLVTKLKILIQNPEYRLRLGEEARRWVCAERKWTDIGAIVSGVYEQLMAEMLHAGR